MNWIKQGAGWSEFHATCYRGEMERVPSHALLLS